MKKNYLLVCLLLIASVSFSQRKTSLKVESQENVMYNTNSPGNDVPKGFKEGLVEWGKDKTPRNKAFGDTLYYDDLDSLSAREWTIFNLNNDGNNWEWTKSHRQGALANPPNNFIVPNIASTTSANGFFSLPSDFYNTPRPATLTEMDVTVTSPPMALSKQAKSVFLSIQQYHARCCFFRDVHFLEVSNDGVNFDTIPGIQNDVPVGSASAGSANPVNTVTLNISRVAANQDTIWVRLRASGNTLWWWMFDDVTITEGPANDLELVDTKVRFYDNQYGIAPIYGRVPFDIFPSLEFQGLIFNNGSDTSRNANMEVDIRRTNDLNGTFVDQHVYNQSEFVTSSNLPGFTDTPNAEILVENDLTYNPLLQGRHEVNYVVSSDSVEQISGDETDNEVFFTTDTTYALDDDAFTIANGIGPADIFAGTSQGGYDGDAVGTMYIIDSSSSNTRIIPTSISFYVSTNTANDGISISPSIWAFNEDTNLLTNAWLPEDFNNTTGLGLLLFGDIYQVQPTDTNSFLTLTLDTTGFAGLDPGQYMVGWEVISGSTTNRDVFFQVADDQTRAAQQPGITSILYHANTTPKTLIANSATTRFQPVIRLNIATLPLQTSVDDPTNSSSEIFEVIPNPSTGQIKINLAVENTAIYNLNVRNTLGQVVYSDVLPVNGAITERLDLSSLGKGVYFLTLEHANETLQKKIILK